MTEPGMLDPSARQYALLVELESELTRSFGVCANDARSDIADHLATLRDLVFAAGVRRKCEPRLDSGSALRVTEFGVRGGASFTALALAGVRVALELEIRVRLTGVDIDILPQIGEFRAYCTNRHPWFEVNLVEGSTLLLDPIGCDVLHIDTLHTTRQLRSELDRHAGGVTHYIAMHDTTTFGWRGEDGTRPGLREAIDEFVSLNRTEWAEWFSVPYNNGMTVLRRGIFE